MLEPFKDITLDTIKSILKSLLNTAQKPSMPLIDSIKTTIGTPVASFKETLTDLPDAPDTNTVPCKTLPATDSAWLDPDTVLSSDPIQSMLQLLPADVAIILGRLQDNFRWVIQFVNVEVLDDVM